MAAYSIALGEQDRVSQLYSYPNAPGSCETLADTVAHWFNQTLQRDGLAAQGATAAVRVEGTSYFLDLDGPPSVVAQFPGYGVRLPQLLANGWTALTETVPQLQAEGKWDPQNTGKWRFFLPHGLAMLNQRSLQFFHYPPIRLLDTMRDYLNDPVPVRWEELLEANGVPSQQEAWLHETVVDAAPIAAPDDQGSAAGGDPKWGLIPIQYFHDYQRAMVQLLLNNAAQHDGYTVPIVVYGAHPRDTFSELYNVKLGVNVAASAEIVPGKKTAILASNHPYMFYATAQGFATVGSGEITPSKVGAVMKNMIKDLVVGRWQVKMADDPSRDPFETLGECQEYWAEPARNAAISALVLHQGSLLYPDPNSLQFTFKWSLEQTRQLANANVLPDGGQ
jgi:hypothetical protein